MVQVAPSSELTGLQRARLIMGLPMYASVADNLLPPTLIPACQSTNMTFQTGQDIVVRGQFLNHSALLNTQDADYRAISDDLPVFAFAHDLGAISAPGGDFVVFSVGHARDPVINYTLGHGNYQYRHPYFLSRYETVEDAVSVHEQRFESITDKSRCRLKLLSKTTPTPCPERMHLTHASTQRHRQSRATTRPLQLLSCDKYSEQSNGRSRKTTMGSTTNRTLLCSSKVSSWLGMFIRMLRCIEQKSRAMG